MRDFFFWLRLVVYKTHDRFFEKVVCDGGNRSSPGRQGMERYSVQINRHSRNVDVQSVPSSTIV